MEGVQVQVPAVEAEAPLQVLFAFGAAVEHGQFRFAPLGPPGKALSGPVEQAAPICPVAE
jgi:hypothetical protein